MTASPDANLIRKDFETDGSILTRETVGLPKGEMWTIHPILRQLVHYYGKGGCLQ